jgi:hypothetical protein
VGNGVRQYVYSASEIGLNEWPSGTLRLEGIPVTENPAEADLFICPGPLMLFQNPADLNRFPFMREHESKHVFFDVSDFETQYGKSCIFLRCNMRTWYRIQDPNTISFPWPVEDYAECVDVPASGFTFDISFQGWLSSNARIDASGSCRRMARLRSDIAEYPDFCGYIFDQPEGLRRRSEFRRSMRQSRIALCPESIPGVFPYRFYEAMSAGRIPLLVGSGYVLPFEDRIPYDEFILKCPADQAIHAGPIASAFLECHSDADVIRMGQLARFYWKTFLNREDWPRRMAEEVLRKIGAVEAAA